MNKSTTIVTIEGLVTASDWDENGNPTNLKICSSGEIDYSVIKNSVSSLLFDKLRKQVIVEGLLSNDGMRMCIEIKSILSSSIPKKSVTNKRSILKSNK